MFRRASFADVSRRKVLKKSLERFERVKREEDRILALLFDAIKQPSWSIEDLTLSDRHEIEQRIQSFTTSDAFVDRLTAVLLNGSLLARWAIKRDGIPVLRSKRVASFAQDDIFTPERVVAYWKNRIPLTDDEAERLLENLNSFQKEALAIAGEYSAAVMEAVAEIFAKAISEGMTLSEFRKLFSEVIPGKSRALIETIYRTNLTKAYSATNLLAMREAGNAVPFVQYVAIIDDDRVTAICRAMHGYIVATVDPLVALWIPPNHYSCRSLWSPIQYLEAIRLGIAAYGPGGRGIVLTRGRRPYGDPPRFVQDGNKIIRLQPAIGFGAGEKAMAIAA